MCVLVEVELVYFGGQEVNDAIKRSMLSVCLLGRGQSCMLYQLCNIQKSISLFNPLCWSSGTLNSFIACYVKKKKKNLTDTNVVLTDAHLRLCIQGAICPA